MQIIHKYFLFFLFLVPSFIFSQNDSIKYSRDFIFNDGVFKTFAEFKNDSPSIKTFIVKKPSPLSDPNYIIIECSVIDSNEISKKYDLNECWGYCYRGDVYISHAFYSYYFRLMTIGSLCHYYGLTNMRSPTAFGNPVEPGISFGQDYQQFMLDFETGLTQLFNYKNFSNFLKIKDNELYQELILEKKKKKVIYKYLLKYNERHPIYFKDV